MTDDVEAVVRLVVGDLVPAARVEWSSDDRGVEVSVFDGAEQVCTAYADVGVPPRDLVVHVADVVQAAAVERTGRAAPPCPGHQHPATMRATPEGAGWTCPETGDVVTGYAVADGPVAH